MGEVGIAKCGYFEPIQNAVPAWYYGVGPNWHWGLPETGFSRMVNARVILIRTDCEEYDSLMRTWHGPFDAPNDDFPNSGICKECRLASRERA